ncbi:F0F1 ATP synthase subunit delta [Dolosigranulum pigrum]|uniref:F0F1 ATP synthase subunit delta n=1 Tax=Dolosigranulum pigrum TaxID=29394 RepID=UPI001AD86A11|nr:F0F1 ATP synthase subunit delta [Dolosigranulum pigrum]QTJ57972.1 hypothetical protein FE336_01505 [Dolosigranulum pigrum]
MDKPHETNNDHQQQIDRLLKRSQPKQTSSLFCDMPEHLTIRSVVPLTEQERTQIVELFSTIIERPLGNVTEIIDPNLICGVSLQSDSHHFEVSGRQQLQKMKLKFHTQV